MSRIVYSCQIYLTRAGDSPLYLLPIALERGGSDPFGEREDD